MSVVELYHRDGRVICQVMDRTDTGLWLASPHVRAFSEPVGAEMLGKAILEMLPLSRPVAHPANWKGLNLSKPLYEAAGVRSWKAFVNGTTSASVREEPGKLIVQRDQNKGAKDGFVPLDQVELPATAAPLELGRAALRALGIAEPTGTYR